MTYFCTKTESTRPTNCTNDTNYITIIISVIRSSYHKVQCSNFKGKKVHIIKFNVQTSKFKGKKVHIIKFKVQTSMFKGNSCFSMSFYLFFMNLLFFLKFMFTFANGFNYIHYLDNARHTNLR